jgi:transcriptional regulator with XRE-family HTH domain
MPKRAGRKRSKRSQTAVARKLGLNPSTVSRILRGESLTNFSRKTIDRVYKTARKTGYPVLPENELRTVEVNRRRFPRKKVRIPVDLCLRTSDGSCGGKGKGILRDLSRGGALLGGVRLEERVFPAEPFTFCFQVSEGSLRDLKGCAVPVHMQVDGGSWAFGLRFAEMEEQHRRRLGRFLLN